MSVVFKSIGKAIRSFINISILLCALIIAPLSILAQFSSDLQSFFDHLAGTYLPHTTVSQTQKKKLKRAQTDASMARKRNRNLRDKVAEARLQNSRLSRENSQLNRKLATANGQRSHLFRQNKELKDQRIKFESDMSRKQKLAIRKSNLVGDSGIRIIKRGTTALGVGWIPWAGGIYDVYSLQEDYSDVCVLLKTIDDLSELLFVTSHLYRNNQCHRRDDILESLRL